MTQLELQDRLGLGIRELEALHELGLGLLLGADDLDYLIDVQIRDQQPCQDV